MDIALDISLLCRMAKSETGGRGSDLALLRLWWFVLLIYSIHLGVYSRTDVFATHYCSTRLQAHPSPDSGPTPSIILGHWATSS